eukprot:m.60817 g.60817  ORF g.60817 m.60817 type:complete len:681 (+) comp22887_c0_seq1:146-2188(+)
MMSIATACIVLLLRVLPATSSVQLDTAESPADLCHLDGSLFKVWDAKGACALCIGNGTGSLVKASGPSTCDGVVMQSTEGMAASFYTAPFIVEPLVVYNVTYEVRTTDLVATTAFLSGGVYAQFFDKRSVFNGTGEFAYGDGWYPGLGNHEVENTKGWVQRVLSFSPPSTAKYTIIHLAFAAHTGGYTPDRIHGGEARGKVEIRNVDIVKTATTNPSPPIQIKVPPSETTLTQAISMVNDCFHNSALTGNFTVGSDYVISGNLSPDLGFGMFGVRRMGNDDQMKLFTKQFWPNITGSQILLAANGMVMGQRVQAQSFWPLGVDNAFSYSGDIDYLKQMLPMVDLSLEWCASRYDTDGLFMCKAEPSNGPEGSDCGGPGMDWVDWSESRASGKTFNFQLWHAFTLKRFAALHDEFATTFGSAATAKIYRTRAFTIETALRDKYWNLDHWWTNYPGLANNNDEMWYDDQVWSLYFNLSNTQQTSLLFNRLSTDGANDKCRVKGGVVPCLPEGVPTMWNNRTRAGRDAETWFGRNGAPNILARFAANQTTHARGLLDRISQVFVASDNIYESYDMGGNLGGDPGSNYLEHCGGYAWALIEGLFGVQFYSDNEASATISDPLSRMKPTWGVATASFVLRGTHVTLTVNPSQHTVSLAGVGPVQTIRVISNGTTSMVHVGTPVTN